MIDFKVLGLAPLLAELDHMEVEVATEGIHEAKLAAAEKLRDAWASNIETEGLVDTGRYRDSITVMEDGEDVGVATDVPYARFLEYGTAYISPHPVAERALQDKADEAFDAAATSLRGHV